jgi:osmotically-inducible protein OsmY
MLTTLPAPSAAPPGTNDQTTITVEQLAIRQLEQHSHFCTRAQTIHVTFHSGTLTLRGRLPSFYLKQLLQEAFRQVEGVKQIDNRVEVVCSNGLSSERD